MIFSVNVVVFVFVVIGEKVHLCADRQIEHEKLKESAAPAWLASISTKKSTRDYL